jgi:hypothetical protein
MRKAIVVLFLPLAQATFAQSGPGGVGSNANNVLWLRADNGVNTTGPSVTGWLDRSGNNNNATPPNVAARPIIVPATLNGYPVLSFDGVNDELRIPDANSLDMVQWDIFLVNSVTTPKNNNVWLSKSSNTQPNYALWSPLSGALTMPIYDIFTLLSSPSTAAGTVGAPYSLLEYNNTVLLGLFPSRTVYKFGNQIYNDINLLQLPAVNANQLYIGNAQGVAGWSLNGGIGELFMYNAPINTAQRIIINNYLAAKYNFALAANDIYTQDNGANGDYDHEMAGIGRISSGSMHTDAQGSAVVRINNPTGLANNEFMLWGHDNGILGAWGSTDFPPGLQGRWFRVWRVSEVSPTGVAVDVGNVDMTFDLTNQGPVTASDLRLLVDINNNGIFADDAPVPIMATAVGGNLYRFAGVSQLVNTRRFTLGTINSAQTPLPIELLYFNAKAERDHTVTLGWATASEHDNSHFTIERSADASVWEALMDVPAVGNSTNTTIYAETDRTPLPDLSYYRLRQVDQDGTTTFSNVVPVRIEEEHDIVVFPDPAQDVVNVLFDASLGKAGVHVINELGQTVPVPMVMKEGSARIDVTLLPEGNYVVMVITDHRVSTVRLIVAR